MKLGESCAFYCYRYMDLPDTTLVQKYQASMDKASSSQSPGCNRQVTAFFFRDWWSLHSRYEHDLRQLLHALRQPDFPAADRQPRAAPMDQRCPETKSSSRMVTTSSYQKLS